MRRFSLIRAVMCDLIVDLRGSANLPAHAEFLKVEISALFKARHNTKLDQFGWPEVLR